MNLYEATNGYIGASHVRCYVIAANETRALEIAKNRFEIDDQGKYQTPSWYENVKVTLLHEDCTKEFISDIED